jgi:tripartite-type tricarboxylate transporter receptor subunit TctC
MLWATPLVAQDYPNKAVRIVVTFPPGGSSDVTARTLSVPLQKNLGQAVVVDNKPGAGGTIAATEIVRATLVQFNTWRINAYKRAEERLDQGV